MKTQIWGIFLILLIFGSSTLWAKPQEIQIKDSKRKIKEGTSKAQIKNIDLQKIEDQEARKAIREILNYLNLQTKK